MRQARILDRILPPRPQLPNRHPPILVELQGIIERSSSIGSRLLSLAGVLQSALGGHEVRSEDYTLRQPISHRSGSVGMLFREPVCMYEI